LTALVESVELWGRLPAPRDSLNVPSIVMGLGPDWLETTHRENTILPDTVAKGGGESWLGNEKSIGLLARLAFLAADARSVGNRVKIPEDVR